MTIITGTTRLFAIIGDPVAPLRSPALFNAAFARLGRDAVFIPLHVSAGSLETVWAGLIRLENLDGLVVTMPHKETILPFLKSLGPTARLTGTVNTVRRCSDGSWEGDMFDGEGFRDGLERAGHAPHGKRIMQIGCGAAGRAIAYALARVGARQLSLQDVDTDRVERLSQRLRENWPLITVSTSGEPIEAQDIVVNATPMGLSAHDPMPVDPSKLRPWQIVADVIPNPEITPLIEAARQLGCQTVTGRAMHEGQARLAASYLGIDGWDD